MLEGVLTKEQTELKYGGIGRLFTKFAISGVVGLMFFGIQTMIDGVILSNFVGAKALAGVNLVMPLYTLMTALAIVIGIGCQTLVSIGFGGNNRQIAQDSVTTAFYSLVGLSVVISSLLWIFTEPMMTILGADKELLPYAVSYIRAMSPFFPVLTVLFLGDYMLKAAGRPYFSMMLLAGTVLMNAFLDYLFIVKFGWETAGAGLATGLAFTVGFVTLLPFLFNPKNIISVNKGRFRLPLLGQMLRNGSSEGLAELSAGITMFMFNRAMMHYVGASGVAAFTSVNYMLFIGITVFVGMSDGIIPIISYNYGASQWSRVKKVIGLALKTSAVIGFILFCILFFGRDVIVNFFFQAKAKEVIDFAIIGAAFCAFAFLMNGFNILFSAFFTALGDAKTSVIISLCRGLLFISLGVLIYPYLFGVSGIWLTIPIAEFLTFLIGLRLFRKRLKGVY